MQTTFKNLNVRVNILAGDHTCGMECKVQFGNLSSNSELPTIMRDQLVQLKRKAFGPSL